MTPINKLLRKRKKQNKTKRRVKNSSKGKGDNAFPLTCCNIYTGLVFEFEGTQDLFSCLIYLVHTLRGLGRIRVSRPETQGQMRFCKHRKKSFTAFFFNISQREVKVFSCSHLSTPIDQ